MYSDIAELREFYTSPLGQVSRRMIRRQLRQLWPNMHGKRILAFGYATPVLRPFLDEAQQVMAFMPAAQGVLPWPRDSQGRVAMVEDYALPLQDSSVDAVILLHALEGSPHTHLLLQEMWRVLSSGGKLLAIVPNRSGLWAQSDSTPFGHGSAFSQRQLRKMLRDNLFIPEREANALYFPPSARRFWLNMTTFLEAIGQRWLPFLAGLHMVEATKQIYPPAGARAPVTAGRVVPATKMAGRLARVR